MRCEYHEMAEQNKKHGVSTIMDSYFSKLMIDILNKPGTEWFINAKDKNFNAIKAISEYDSHNLPHSDVLIFLHVSEDLHKFFLNIRSRESEVDHRIFKTQQVFFNAAKKYAHKHSKQFLFIRQEINNVNKVVDNIIDQLLKRNLISNNENAI